MIHLRQLRRLDSDCLALQTEGGKGVFVILFLLNNKPRHVVTTLPAQKSTSSASVTWSVVEAELFDHVTL